MANKKEFYNNYSADLNILKDGINENNFTPFLNYINKRLGKKISFKELIEDLKKWKTDKGAQEKIENKYSFDKDKISLFRLIESLEENPKENYSKLKMAKDITDWANSTFYEGGDVVDLFLCYEDILRASDIGDISGSALCHSIAQRNKEAKIGDVKLSGETVYQALAKVINLAFGAERASEKIPYHSSSRGPDTTASELWHTDLSGRFPYKTREVLGKIIKEDKFNKEAYSNPENKKILIEGLEEYAINDIITNLEQDWTRRDILTSDSYDKLREIENIEKREEAAKEVMRELLNRYENYRKGKLKSNN